MNDPRGEKVPLPTVEEFIHELEERLQSMQREGKPIDTLTFAGNGEPTLHPHFKSIIEATLQLRNEYYPQAAVAVLSDAATLHQKQVLEALMMVDKPIMKIDAGSEEMFRKIAQPVTNITLAEIVKRMKAFSGKLIIQSLFLRGNAGGVEIDNTTPDELGAMIEHYRVVSPQFIMVYSIDREPPFPGLEKLPEEELVRIANSIREAGFDVEHYA
ncbi:MAG: radical SAM protein [Chlorobi bacterium]|nr:radical SAM protein [Chlorobiota bacterium]